MKHFSLIKGCKWIFIDKYLFSPSAQKFVRKCIGFIYRDCLRAQINHLLSFIFATFYYEKNEVFLSSFFLYMRFNIRRGDKYRNLRDLKPYLDAMIIVADYSLLNQSYVFTFSTSICTYRRTNGVSFLSLRQSRDRLA